MTLHGPHQAPAVAQKPPELLQPRARNGDVHTQAHTGIGETRAPGFAGGRGAHEQRDPTVLSYAPGDDRHRILILAHAKRHAPSFATFFLALSYTPARTRLWASYFSIQRAPQSRHMSSRRRLERSAERSGRTYPGERPPDGMRLIADEETGQAELLGGGVPKWTSRALRSCHRFSRVVNAQVLAFGEL